MQLRCAHGVQVAAHKLSPSSLESLNCNPVLFMLWLEETKASCEGSASPRTKHLFVYLHTTSLSNAELQSSHSSLPAKKVQTMYHIAA